jgi:hypothetical protein
MWDRGKKIMRPVALVTNLLFAFTCLGIASDGPAPQVNSISPTTAKPGDILDITGVGLDVSKIDEIYLTDHKFDMKVKVLDQSEKAIKLRVPPFAKPGRMQILVLTKGADPKLLEEPVYVLIEEATTEISEAKKPDKQETKQEKQ